MADIPIREGLTFRSEDVFLAKFWEAGADWGEVKRPQDRVERDTLKIKWKDREQEPSTMQGPEARRVYELLQKSGHPVFCRWKVVSRDA